MVSFAIFRAFCYILASKVLKIAREIQTWSTVHPKVFIVLTHKLGEREKFPFIAKVVLSVSHFEAFQKEKKTCELHSSYNLQNILTQVNTIHPN